MTFKPVALLLADLSVTQSRSHVSNDLVRDRTSGCGG